MIDKTKELIENAFGKRIASKLIHITGGVFETFPKDYIEFLNIFNGGNGNIGGNAYLHLWAYEEIEELNHDYCVSEYLTDVILIGSDGGDTAFGINAKGQYIEVPFIGMDDEEIVVLAKNFDDFINQQSQM